MKIKREVTKFSRTTDRLLGEYPIKCSVKTMRRLFDVGDDHLMYWCYRIETPEQIAFFKNLGVPVTKRAEFFVECYAE